MFTNISEEWFDVLVCWLSNSFDSLSNSTSNGRLNCCKYIYICKYARKYVRKISLQALLQIVECTGTRRLCRLSDRGSEKVPFIMKRRHFRSSCGMFQKLRFACQFGQPRTGRTSFTTSFTRLLPRYTLGPLLFGLRSSKWDEICSKNPSNNVQQRSEFKLRKRRLQNGRTARW